MLALLPLLLGCAPDDGCAATCDVALARYEACLPEWGLEWGVAYEDAADFRNWCDTWAWEQRQLGQADRCAEVTGALEDADCMGYAAAWSVGSESP